MGRGSPGLGLPHREARWQVHPTGHREQLVSPHASDWEGGPGRPGVGGKPPPQKTETETRSGKGEKPGKENQRKSTA